MIYALQGNLNLSNDTEQTIFTPSIVDAGLKYAKDLSVNENFSVFHDANLSLYKMTGMNEYDKYKDEILSELFIDLTKFGTTSDIQNGILNKVVHQLGIDFTKTNTNTMQNTQKQTIKQHFK